MAEPGEYKTIPIEKTCIGMFIHLNMGWLNHPFATNSFCIKDQQQLAILRQLGLKTILFDPTRSRLPPTDESLATPATNPPSADLKHEISMDAKRLRLENLSKQRSMMAECERKFVKAADSVKTINQKLFSRPAECVAAANSLVEIMLEGLTTDKDIALVLVGESSGSQQEIYYHALNVAVLAMILGREMSCSNEELSLLGLGAMFHDIGKVKLPDKLLLKSGPLTTSERNLLQQHPLYGMEIVKSLKLPEPVIAMALHHHENADGSGYPRHLSGNQIGKLTSILSIANTFDNLCNRINPADSLPPYAALASMFTRQRTHFDLTALSTFIRSMGVYPPGTLVVLSNEMRGLVVSVNSEKPLKPNVLVYDPDVPKDEAIILDLEEVGDITIAKSLKPSQLDQTEMAYLNPRKRLSYYFEETSSGQR